MPAAELVEVLEASAERVIPRCGHFGSCGGCHYQHMNYPAQLKAKAAILREQLERLGGLRDFPPVEIIAAPEEWNYRNNMQFHLTREGKLGFLRANSNQTFAIRECHLPMESINWLWPLVEVEPMPGLERISMRAGVNEDLMLILDSSDPQPLDFSIEDLPVSVVQMGPAGSTVLAGSDALVMEVLGRRFKVSAGSFFQVNTLQAQAMVNYLTEHLAIDEKSSLVDAYCGVGLFSAFLAPRVQRLVGIELSAGACEDFATNLDEFDHVELYEDAVENVLSQVHFDSGYDHHGPTSCRIGRENGRRFTGSRCNQPGIYLLRSGDAGARWQAIGSRGLFAEAPGAGGYVPANVSHRKHQHVGESKLKIKGDGFYYHPLCGSYYCR